MVLVEDSHDALTQSVRAGGITTHEMYSINTIFESELVLLPR